MLSAMNGKGDTEMVNALGQITTHGTAVRNMDKEGHDSVVSECHTRKATLEELEHYFGGPHKRPAHVKNVMSKDALRERLHPPLPPAEGND